MDKGSKVVQGSTLSLPTVTDTLVRSTGDSMLTSVMVIVTGCLCLERFFMSLEADLISCRCVK